MAKYQTCFSLLYTLIFSPLYCFSRLMHCLFCPVSFLTCFCLLSCLLLLFSASVTISDLVSSGFGSWAALTRRLSLALLYSARGQRSEQLRVDPLHRGPNEGQQDWHGTLQKALRRAGGCVINTPHVDHEVGRKRLLLILVCLCLHEPELLFCSLQLHKNVELFTYLLSFCHCKRKWLFLLCKVILYFIKTKNIKPFWNQLEIIINWNKMQKYYIFHICLV